MQPSKRSVNEAYAEIELLTGQRAELERQRFLLIKAIRGMRAIRQDNPINDTVDAEVCGEFDTAIFKLEGIKSELWKKIEETDASIQRLMDLAQNGAFNG